jgi:putative tryptophan/tyrosine transport system substrate-binding protein
VRRLWLCPFLVALLLLGISPPLLAQQVAVLKSRDSPAFTKVLDGVADIFLGNSAMELVEFNLAGKKKSGKKVAKEIRLSAPRLVLAMGPLAASVSQEYLSDIPVIYCMVSNPQRYELAGNNIAGIAHDVPGETQFEYYKAMVPSLRTLGVIYDPEKSGALVKDAKDAARSLGLELIGVEVSSHKKVPQALRGLLGRIDALWMVPDDTVLTTDSFRFLLVTSFENKLPFLAISDIFVKVGALATIATQPEDLGRQVGKLLLRFDRGELDLAAVDVLPPGQTDVVINVKTAEKIGLSLSPEILRSASKLYQ